MDGESLYKPNERERNLSEKMDIFGKIKNLNILNKNKNKNDKLCFSYTSKSYSKYKRSS